MSVPPDVQRKKNARARIRHNSGKISTAFEDLYKPVEEWDMEELAKGRPRAVNGTWAGSTPKWITPAIRDEAQRRLQTMGRSMLREQLFDAVKVVANLATDDETDDDGKPLVPASVRLQAATYLIDQVLGKPTAKVELDAGQNLKDMLAGALVLPGGASATVIEGELVNDEEDDEDGFDESPAGRDV